MGPEVLNVLTCFPLFITVALAKAQLNLPPYSTPNPSFDRDSPFGGNQPFPGVTPGGDPLYSVNGRNGDNGRRQYGSDDVFRPNNPRNQFIPNDNDDDNDNNVNNLRPNINNNRPVGVDPNDPDNRIDNRVPNRRPQDPRFVGSDIRSLLQALDVQESQQCTNNVAAQWNFETDVNEATQLDALNAQEVYSDFQHGVWELLRKVTFDKVQNVQTYRLVRFLAVVGPAALPPDQLDRYNRLINDMLAVYNSASICAFKDPFQCGLKIQPDLSEVMAKSRDWAELQHVWTEWRRNSGNKIKDTYEQLVDLTNQAAQLNNFTDASEYWAFPYESPTFQLDLEDAWTSVKPLYELLHAYVRRKLREYYGPENINRQAPLPAHILGNMWAQSWTNIFDITQPYPGRYFLDATPEMIRQGYTPIDIVRLAEEFFYSLNFTSLPNSFYTSSLFEEPLDRQVICQASAWDFCNRDEYRLKMCTRVTMKDLITAHHEMAHIHYFLQYRNQPKGFRDGANPAFHEAIGEAIGLSVGTPRHLQTIGLVQNSVDDTSVDINFLYSVALDKVAFLPFAYVMDLWRYDVFRGQIGKDQYNCHWWRLREQYSGLKPPVLRSEHDFDPGSKYHIPANIPYMRFYVSTILQFQIYRALCKSAGQYSPEDPTRPLHKCDIYRSQEAGRILRNIMEKGSSVQWNQLLLETIGETRLDGNAMRDYFRPLEEWLRNENLRTGEYLGWLYDGDYCKQSIQTAGLQVYGGFYNNSPSLKPKTFTLCITLLLSIIFYVKNYY